LYSTCNKVTGTNWNVRTLDLYRTSTCLSPIQARAMLQLWDPRTVESLLVTETNLVTVTR
jgi:hypothetical protein